MNALVLLLAACSGSTAETGKAVDTGLGDSETGQAETSETADTADSGDTGETGETAETGDSDTEVDTAPPPCDRTLGWKYVAAGTYQTCGIHTDGCAECWGRGKEEDTGGDDTGGRYHWNGEDVPPEESFTSIAMIATPASSNSETPIGCGIRDDWSGVCWGNYHFGRRDIPEGTYAELAVIGSGGWGLHTEATIEHWGFDQVDPSGSFISVATSLWSTAFLTVEGELLVRDYDGVDEEYYLPGTYIDISMGSSYGCAISTDGSILCWDPQDPENAEFEYLTMDAPVGDWVGVCNVAGGLACALDSAGGAVCWDTNDTTWAAPADEVFTQIACGKAHVCGVTVDQRITCWGLDFNGETIPPT